MIPTEQLTWILLQDGTIVYWLNFNTSQLYQDSMDLAIERSMYPLKYNILKDILQRYINAKSGGSRVFMYQEARRFGCTERAYNLIIHELLDQMLIIKDVSNN